MSNITPNESLANLIFIFHTIIVLFVLFGSFIDIPAILILHITFCACLLVHWYGNSNVCSLSLLESQLRGLDRTETFSHKFIAPIYDINETDWSTICYSITIFTMLLSIYYLYNNTKFKQTYNCICNLNFTTDTPFSEKMVAYIDCIKPLFLVEF